MASGPSALPKMMLGFVVRRCAVAVGHDPSAEEFAAWANAQQDGGQRFCLFGRPITVHEARLILRHPGRAVTARTAAPHEQIKEDGEPSVRASFGKVTPFAAAAARLKARRKSKF